MTTLEAITACRTLITALQPRNPALQFAYTSTGTTVGVWSETDSRYLPYADLTLFGTFVEAHGCLVNGEPLPRTWMPCAKDTTLPEEDAG